MQVPGGVGHPHDFRFESGGQDGGSFLGVPFFILPVASALSLIAGAASLRQLRAGNGSGTPPD
jgi:hypothetical protein